MKRIVALQNGLGNQMFEYAFYLALRQRDPDTVTTTYLFSRRCDHNGLELDRIFDIKLQDTFTVRLWMRIYRKLYYLSRRNDVCGTLCKALLQLLCHLRAGLCMDRPEVVYEGEESYAWKSNYKVYWGGWMSEKWFLPAKEEVIKSFTFRPSKCSAQTRELQKELAQSTRETVSIHIRRGDYLKNPQYFEICNKGYYEKAINLLSEKVERPRYYLFSDDVEWCRANLHLPQDTTYVDWNTRTDSWQDMYLMSNCRHHIIANSTFSWWGAWLNASPHKIVVCPKEFSRTENIVNVMPESWIKIDHDGK